MITDQRLAYKVEEAVSVVGLGRTTLRALIATGELESIKVGRVRLIPADALADFISRRREAAREVAVA